jgi:hypothetical protein
VCPASLPTLSANQEPCESRSIVRRRTVPFALTAQLTIYQPVVASVVTGLTETIAKACVNVQDRLIVAE